MSGFFGSNDSTSRWGGLLKQAISNVETTFDSLLEQPQQQSQQSKGKFLFIPALIRRPLR